MKCLGDRIRFLRESKEMSQKELSEILNVHKATVSNWEINKRSPDKDMLKVIANYFGVSVDYLLGNENDKKIEKAVTLREELIRLMIKRGLIKNEDDLNEEHLNLIEIAIKTYKDNNK